MNPCQTDNPYQSWEVWNDGGEPGWVNVRTGLCLDVNPLDGYVQAQSCNGAASLWCHWQFGWLQNPGVSYPDMCLARLDYLSFHQVAAYSCYGNSDPNHDETRPQTLAHR